MVNLSDSTVSRVLIIVLLSFALPIGLIVVIFDMVGIGEYVFPILIPIFGFTFIILLVLLGGIILIIRSTSGSINTTQQPQSSYYPPQRRKTTQMYMVPMYCTSCGRELHLSQVEWRNDYTMVCPSCFADIRISQSN